MHTLQDSTSPVHHGFQPWYDYYGGKCNPAVGFHLLQEAIDPGVGSWLYIATDEAYGYFHDKDKPLPADFFADLGADRVGGGILNFLFPTIDIIPDFNVSLIVDAVGGIAF